MLINENTHINISVLFEDPFWVAIYERNNNGRYEVCKITFGAEPKDYEVYEFLERNYKSMKFSPPVKTDKIEVKHKNPKTVQRKAKKAIEDSATIGTKAQQALKLMQEQNKTERKIKTKAQKEAEIQKKYELQRQKKKQKHKGR